MDPAAAQATSRELFREGLEAFERDDLATAIRRWTAAHEAIDGVADLDDARHLIELALGQAHVRAYDLDHDRWHLRVARPFIASYLEWTGREGHELTALEREDRPRALTLLARIDILLEPKPVPRPATPRVEPRKARHSSADEWRTSTAMLAGGGFAIGVAALALAGTIGGFSRDSVIVGATSAVLLVVGTTAGVPLLIEGARRRKRIRADVAVARGSAHARLVLAF